MGAFYNSGQNCGAASRFFVQRAVYEEFAQKFVAAAKKLVVGDPLKPSTMIGPVAYKGHRDRIEGFVERAKKSGATPSGRRTARHHRDTERIFRCPHYLRRLRSSI